MGRVPLLKDVWQDCFLLFRGPLIAGEAAVETAPWGSDHWAQPVAAPFRSRMAGPVWLLHLASEELFPGRSP